MGMNVWCCRWWTITYDKLKELCGPEVAAVESTFDIDGNVGWVEAANDAFDDCDPALAEAVHALLTAFEAATGGLHLVLLSYDADMDVCRAEAREREHEGILFCVDFVEDFTPAGSRFKHVLVDTKWTEAW
jgi:hypothetical protein